MDLNFESEKDLYKRLMPALKTKKSELRQYGYGYLKIEDIWNYLKEKIWNKSHGLLLNDMVNDILNASNEDIDNYFKEKLKDKNRNIYFEKF